MKVRKTVKAKITGFNSEEAQHLRREYRRWKDLLRLKEEGLEFLSLFDKIKSGMYSAAAQQVHRVKGDTPLRLRNDSFWVKKAEGRYRIKIPVKEVRGGIKLPLEVPYKYFDDLKKCKVRGSWLKYEDGKWWACLTLEKEVETDYEPTAFIGVDLGHNNPATFMAIADGIQGTGFCGRKIKQIRSKYGRMRKITKKKGASGVFKDKERRKVEDALHKASRKILEKAEKLEEQGYRVVVVIGDIKGHRNQDWGKRGNKRLHSMPTHQLKEQIKYKCEWEGIRTELVDEYHTSKKCHKCGSLGKRPTQGLFKCPECGVEYNADLNAAINIVDKFRDKLGEPTAVSEQGEHWRPRDSRSENKEQRAETVDDGRTQRLRLLGSQDVDHDGWEEVAYVTPQNNLSWIDVNREERVTDIKAEKLGGVGNWDEDGFKEMSFIDPERNVKILELYQMLGTKRVLTERAGLSQKITMEIVIDNNRRKEAINFSVKDHFPDSFEPMASYGSVEVNITDGGGSETVDAPLIEGDDMWTVSVSHLNSSLLSGLEAQENITLRYSIITPNVPGRYRLPQAEIYWEEF